MRSFFVKDSLEYRVYVLQDKSVARIELISPLLNSPINFPRTAETARLWDRLTVIAQKITLTEDLETVPIEFRKLHS